MYKSNLIMVLENVRMYKDDVEGAYAERDRFCKEYLNYYPELTDEEMTSLLCNPSALNDSARYIWGSKEECLSLIDDAKQNLARESIHFVGPKLQHAFEDYEATVCSVVAKPASVSSELESAQVTLSCPKGISDYVYKDKYGGSFGETLMSLRSSKPHCICKLNADWIKEWFDSYGEEDGQKEYESWKESCRAE